jgi:hypothetical protein
MSVVLDSQFPPSVSIYQKGKDKDTKGTASTRIIIAIISSDVLLTFIKQIEVRINASITTMGIKNPKKVQQAVLKSIRGYRKEKEYFSQ